MTVSSAFLAPDIVKAAVEGRLPRGYGLKRLIDLPLAWPDQWRTLGTRDAGAGVMNAKGAEVRLQFEPASEAGWLWAVCCDVDWLLCAVVP